MKQLGMSKIFQAITYNANTAMDDECDKLRMWEATNDLASLISFFNFESDEMPIEEYVLAGTGGNCWYKVQHV